MSPAPDAAAHGSLRARILWPAIALVAIALAVSGLMVALIQYRAVAAGVDEQLLRSRDELRVLAEKGIDPDTGQPFAGASELLRTYLQRTVRGEAEGELAFVDGRVAWVASAGVALRPETDPQLVDAARALAAGGSIVVETITTDRARYRALVAPVSYPDDTGALLQVVDMGVAERELRRTVAVYAGVAAATLALVALAAWLLVGRALRPIEELREAAGSIDERDLTTRVPVRGNDDLARLSATINRMLDRVQRSVEGQQRLLDDVGHELRTPITVVRGHLELLDPHDPAEVAQTRDLVVEEVDRMGVLVGDLLTLARAGESDFVTPAWVELAPLTDQTFVKASALGQRAWRLADVADAEAWLDAGRVTQAWLQLAANAVKYSQPGSPITIGSALSRGEARLWVRDRGVGIAPEELETVRARFGRARSAAAQAQGSGLGLSIVETILAAHDGRLEIDSTPGEGSTFTMILPLGPRQAQEEARG